MAYISKNILKPINADVMREIQTKQLNNNTFLDYFYRLEELAINMFEWKNLPSSVDERFIELSLCELGYALYFNDDVLGNLALTCMIGGELDVYRIPTKRRAYAVNGYQKECTNKDSVLIFNNYLHTPTILTIMLFARRLYEIERTIDVNVLAQKTPVCIVTDEKTRLSMLNLFKKYTGNEPMIIGSKGLDLNNVKTLSTNAPYVASELNILKRQIWNEALTFFGIENNSNEKRERLVTGEVNSNLGGVQAQRYVMLNARRQAAKQINAMFGTNIEVNFRQDFSAFDMSLDETGMIQPDEEVLVNG